jgi:hypothetical protein
MTTPAPKKFPLIPVLVGLGAIALIATVLLTMSNSPTEGEFGAPTVSGTALPLAGGNPDPALGITIPEVVGADFDGTEVRIANDGRAKMLVFLAHWCSHCQAEVPVVQDWLDAGLLRQCRHDQGGDPQFRPAQLPIGWLEREGWASDDRRRRRSAIATAFGPMRSVLRVRRPTGSWSVAPQAGLPAETLTEIATTLAAMVGTGE